MRRFVRSAAYKLTKKRIAEKKLDIIDLELSRNEVLYFNLSSNPIMSFKYKDKLCYFRECPSLQKRADYYRSAVDNFFETLGNLGISEEHFKQEIPIRLSFDIEETESFKDIINRKTSDKSFIKALYNADIITEKHGFSIWETPNCDEKLLAKFLLSDIDKSLYDLAVYFIWYMRSAATRFKSMKIACGKKHSFFAAVRSISSRIVAEELGLSRMITDARLCRLRLGKESILGVLSDSAAGTRMSDTAIKPCGVFQKELTSLALLDAICNQPDHGPNNYNVCADGTVCAFDNDNPRTFFPTTGVSSVLTSNGMINRPLLDKKLAEKLAQLDKKSLNNRLKPYLNLLQRKALFSRINKINKAIIKSGVAFLADDTQWSDATVKEELSGKYGNTYLTIAVSKMN